MTIKVVLLSLAVLLLVYQSFSFIINSQNRFQRPLSTVYASSEPRSDYDRQLEGLKERIQKICVLTSSLAMSSIVNPFMALADDKSKKKKKPKVTFPYSTNTITLLYLNSLFIFLFYLILFCLFFGS
jgi:hypothetical protein